MPAIAECCFFGVPPILIPYPHAGGHQKFNAQYLLDNSAAIVHPQSEVDGDKLRLSIKRLHDDTDFRAHLQTNILNLSQPDATATLAQAVLDSMSTEK